MAFLVGALLALSTGVFAMLVGFDRERGFYPVVLIVVASYYCLFAVLGGSEAALWIEAGIAGLFAAAAVLGFRTGLWLVAAGLAAHGGMDFIHHHLVTNPGVPSWWPAFCGSFDVAAAIWLGLVIRLRRTPLPM